MPRHHLNKEKITEEALALIVEEGFERFSMRDLAKRLSVQPSSLYNHVRSAEALFSDIARLALAALNRALRKASAGKRGREALLSLALAYRDFVRENPEIYKVIMAVGKIQDPAFDPDGMLIVEPVEAVIRNYGIDPSDAVRAQRMIRSFLHGFCSLEASGFFTHLDESAGDSFRGAVDLIDRSLLSFEKGGESLE